MNFSRRGKQLKILLWKNFVMHRRRPVLLAFELLVPILIICLPLIGKGASGTQSAPNATYFSPVKLNGPYNAFYKPGLWYAPNHSYAKTIVDGVLKKLNFNFSDVRSFSSEKELATAVEFFNTSYVHQYFDVVLIGLIFNNIEESTKELPKDIQYTIRIKSSEEFQTTLTHRTQLTTRLIHAKGSETLYEKTLFLRMQYLIDQTMIQLSNPSAYNTSSPDIEMMRMPYPPYEYTGFTNSLFLMLSLVFIFGYLLHAVHIVSRIVREKEKKLKETMKMMGMPSFLHWTAWFLNYFLVMVAISVCQVLILRFADMLPKSSPFLVFLLLVLSCMAIIFSSFLVSVFFNNSKTATLGAGILYFLTFIPFTVIVVYYDQISKVVKIPCCLIPSVAMGLGIHQILLLELSGSGAQWDHIVKSTTLPDDIALWHIFLMLLVDCILYMFIAWYKDTIAPGDFGIPQPWYFLFTSSYWNNIKKVQPTREARETNSSNTNDSIPKDPEGEVTISLQNLTKEFGSGSKVKTAVNNLNLNIFKGQITTFLGHNGAGKTTTMSMLAGFLAPTSGTAVVSGFDVRYDVEKIRQAIGLCPQHNVLFGRLTVKEHMEFFGELKGISGNDLEEEIQEMLKSTGLKGKKDAQTRTLSGGMKRRLSVALALIGGSKVVILDEPSSGLDPESRRGLWTFLQTELKDRTMLLSTQFMDEADNLSDRIAIMASGKIQCVGTPLFLKSKYGAGYSLTLVKGSKFESATVMEKCIRRHVPEAVLKSEIAQEVVVLLPSESSSSFEPLFTELERERGQYGIESYGMSITTMEEVFLKVGENVHEEDEDTVDGKDGADQVNGRGADQVNGRGADQVNRRRRLLNDDTENSNHQLELLTGISLWLSQCKGLLVKRFRYTARSYISLVIQLLMPLLFTMIAFMTISKEGQTSAITDVPSLTIGFDDKYFPQTVSYGFNIPGKNLLPFASDVMNNYVASFKSSNVRKIDKENSTPSINKFLSTLVKTAEKDIGKYNREFLVGAIFQTNNANQLQIDALYSSNDYHSPAISLNHISNALLQTVSPGHRIRVVSHPFPYNRTTYSTATQVHFTTPLIVVVGLAIMLSTFIVIIVRERVSKTKLLHYVTGTSSTVYWLTNLFWDYIIYIVVCAPPVIFVAAYEVDQFDSPEQTKGFFALVFLYGWATIPLLYMISYIFGSPSSALAWTLIGNIFIVLITLLLVSLRSMESKGQIEAWVFMVLFPNFCIGNGLRNLFRNNANMKQCNVKEKLELCEKTTSDGGGCCIKHCKYNCLPFNESYFALEDPGIGRELIFMAVQGFVYLLLCLLSDSTACGRCCISLSPIRRVALTVMREKNRSGDVEMSDQQPEDPDVAEERQKVMRSDSNYPSNASLCMKGLTHYYGTHCAVDDVTCHVESGQCFGLLGVNGAGKTTTFRMLTGDLDITAGDAFIHGTSITHSPGHVYRAIGYCPQFDAHVDQLTGREMLYLYGRLRGIQEKDLKREVDDIITKIMLSKYADKQAAIYSGGNKRKLSIGIALIGNPRVVFLDEPTTGVDPEARRHLWNTLSSYRASDRTLILTSHSMEECEALCTQVAIMVNGQFKCFGSIQHLKAKFGEGYTLFAQVPFSSEAPPADDKVQHFKKFVRDKFRTAKVLKDEHQGLLHYQLLPGEGITWPRVFGLMESYREELCLENYSVSQTTLEQIFIEFAKHQEDEKKKPGSLDICLQCMGCRKSKKKQTEKRDDQRPETLRVSRALSTTRASRALSTTRVSLEMEQLHENKAYNDRDEERLPHTSENGKGHAMRTQKDSPVITESVETRKLRETKTSKNEEIKVTREQETRLEILETRSRYEVKVEQRTKETRETNDTKETREEEKTTHIKETTQKHQGPSGYPDSASDVDHL